MLADLGKAAQESILTAQEKTIFAQRIANAGTAVLGYVDFLTDMEKRQAANGQARPFRIGKALYEQKFALDIQSSSSAEQTYRKALATREELLTRMDKISDELWPRYMAGVTKPADRFQKIGMMIDKLSARHVKRQDFFPEIRRQIPLLQDWVIKHDLLTLDPSKPLEVRETPMYQRGVAGASIDAPGPYRPKDKTYYNVTPLDSLTRCPGRKQPARVQRMDPADPEHPRSDSGPLRAAGAREPFAVADQVPVRQWRDGRGLGGLRRAHDARIGLWRQRARDVADVLEVEPAQRDQHHPRLQRARERHEPGAGDRPADAPGLPDAPGSRRKVAPRAR